MRTTKAPLKDFTDYRAFLHHYVRDAKEKNRGFSCRGWAKRLGFSDPSTLTKILNGQREPGPEVTRRLAAYFEFSPKDTEYFEAMVKLGRTKTRESATAMSEVLAKLVDKAPSATLLEEKAFLLVADWFCFAIRELMRRPDFRDDPAWIAKRLRFKVSPAEARRAVQVLVDLGLAKRQDDGRVVHSEESVDVGRDVPSTAIRHYHAQMLDHAKEALATIPPEGREFGANTFVMDQRRLADAKQKLREFKHRFREEFEADAPEAGAEVFHLEMGFFPVTQSTRSSP